MLTACKKELLPALGKPTRPTSARTFKTIFISLDSPSLPRVFFLGALFVEVLNRTFPKPCSPPFATINVLSSLSKSHNSSFVILSVITQPRGRSIIRSSPFLPCLFLLPPALPFSAVNMLLFLKSARVFRLSVPLMIIEPPLPPSPPSGPPKGIYFSRLKLRQPEPPLPALTVMTVSSINFIAMKVCFSVLLEER